MYTKSNARALILYSKYILCPHSVITFMTARIYRSNLKGFLCLLPINEQIMEMAFTYRVYVRQLQFSTRVSCSQSGESGAKERREWEEAMAAVLRDIASSPKKQPPPVVQIVIYESSVWCQMTTTLSSHSSVRVPRQDGSAIRKICSGRTDIFSNCVCCTDSNPKFSLFFVILRGL